MEPKDIKALYEKQQQERAAINAAHTEAQRAQHDALRAEAEAGKKAIREVVLPYFAELEIELGKQHFVHSVTASEGGSPVEVSFRIDNGFTYVIQTGMAGVLIRKLNLSGPAGKNLNTMMAKPIKVYSQDEAPFIRLARDLTRESVGNLVKMALEGK